MRPIIATTAMKTPLMVATDLENAANNSNKGNEATFLVVPDLERATNNSNKGNEATLLVLTGVAKLLVKSIGILLACYC